MSERLKSALHLRAARVQLNKGEEGVSSHKVHELLALQLHSSSAVHKPRICAADSIEAVFSRTSVWAGPAAALILLRALLCCARSRGLYVELCWRTL